MSCYWTVHTGSLELGVAQLWGEPVPIGGCLWTGCARLEVVQVPGPEQGVDLEWPKAVTRVPR